MLSSPLFKRYTYNYHLNIILEYRAAAWIGYYWLLPNTIGYFPHSFKINELSGGKIYGNNSMFYGDIKILTQ